MPIIYRHEKGIPLTAEEVDGNFSELDQRVQQLETKPIMAEGIRSIIQEGDQIVITGTFGTTWGPFILPKCLPRPRGDWQENTPYAIGDWVILDKDSFACMKAHMSGHAFESEFWKVVVKGESL